MKLRKIIQLLLITIFLTSCGGSKIKKILSQGSIQENQFKKTFPFEYTKTGHILVKVIIKNEEYDFILDTGATTIISEELAEKLNIKPIGSSVIGDINDNETTLNYVNLESIEIGGINFKNTIGSILNLKKDELACLEVDGLIGANLMRHAVWDFDFQKQKITITNDENKLSIPNNHSDSKIFVGDAYQVSLITKVNNERVLNSLVDLGNTGKSKLTYTVFKKLNNAKYVKGSGYNGGAFGAFGKVTEKRNSYNVMTKTITIDNTIINNEIMVVKDGDTNLGLPLFKNYRVIFNWKTRSFKMIKQQEKTEKSSLETFGFIPVAKNNKLYVDYLYDNTKASKILKLKDQILSINDKDYSFFNMQEWCKVIQKKVILLGSDDAIKIKVLRKGKELEFKLDKVKLL